MKYSGGIQFNVNEAETGTEVVVSLGCPWKGQGRK